MDKESLLSIAEFSRITHMPQSALRYYDELGLFLPAGRGKKNGRLYNPYQTIELDFVAILIALGTPLSEIKHIAVARTPELISELLKRREAALDRKLDEIREAYSILHTYRTNIDDGMSAKDGEIRIESASETAVMIGRANDYKGNDGFYNEFFKFRDTAKIYRINLKYPIGGYHSSMETFEKYPNRPDGFFSQDAAGSVIVPAGQYLVGFKMGYYGELDGMPQKMVHFAAEHGLTFTGRVYITYLIDELSTNRHENYIARCSVAIK
jgi:DNA-binding transcriptional MerR regulator/effector-binding domain-containing protein